jgi:hypothetical protein
MDALVDEGFTLPGGPLGGEDRGRWILHVIRAASEQAIRDKVASDPGRATAC